MKPNECQLPSLKGIAEGNAQSPLRRRFILTARNCLNARQIEAIHQCTSAAKALWGGIISAKPAPVTSVHAEPLQAGDWVRVRSKAEIMATLDNTGKLKGCSFMAANGMGKYCGTIQRVLQPMTRFLDECDMRSIKKCKGLVLLDGVLCKGGTDLGHCDRGCFSFWREEWLEKLMEIPLHEESAEQAPILDIGAVKQAALLRPGGLIRVRTKEEIEATLDSNGKLKGLCFMDAMERYCGTVHRVLQPMTRFIDEEEKCTPKNCSGLVLLEGVRCSGDTSIGHCDRSCLLFWRVEWLEKLVE